MRKSTENPEIFENLPEGFRNQILKSGILKEYQDIIDLYRAEHQIDTEEQSTRESR